MTATMMEFKERQRSVWSGAARAWDARFEWYTRAFSPMIEWCCGAVALAPGSRVLDIASGSGQPALTAAGRVLPGGSVKAVDISPEMLLVAERRARAAGLDNIEFIEMDAEELRFDAETFDAVTCTCGLMFLPDVERALSEIRRVLKPGGRAAFAVWDLPAKSPFLTIGGQAVAQFFPPSPPDPKAPGAFRFAPPGVLTRVLQDAEFEDVVVESVPMPIALASPDEYWTVFTDMAAGIKERIETLAPDEQVRLRDMVIAEAGRHVQGGHLRLEATPLCASART